MKKHYNLLKQKHPDATNCHEDIALHGPIRPFHPIVYEEINEDLVLKAVKLTKGGSGPAGMVADGCREALASKVYGESGNDLRKALANVIKKICIKDISDNSLEAFLACRLIPLDKMPGLRPIGVGEVLRRIARQSCDAHLKERRNGFLLEGANVCRARIR